MKIEEADLLTSSELEQKVKEIYKMYDILGEWLNQRPTEPGWYWYMDDDYKRVVHVWRGGVSGILFVEERSITPITDPRFDHILWWSQPLVPPN